MAVPKLLFNDVPLKECGLIYPFAAVDPIYKSLKLLSIYSINTLLVAYEQGDIVLNQSNLSVLLEGLIDLIKFQYFKEYSNEIIQILDTRIMVSSFNSSILDKKEENLLYRLGFNSSQIGTFVGIIRKQPKGKKIISYILLDDFLDIQENNRRISALKNKISLLREMYSRELKPKEVEKGESYPNTIPNDERNYSIGRIRIENFGFLPRFMNESPVYKLCMMNKYYTIASLFQAYNEKMFRFEDKTDYLYLEGIIDLIKFQYYGEESNEMLSTLNELIFLEKGKDGQPTLSPKTKQHLKRLGFFKTSIKWVEEHLIKLLGKSKTIKIIDFLEKEKKDTHLFALDSKEYAYYHIISLLVKMYQLYYSPENERLRKISDVRATLDDLIERAALLAKTIQETQEELTALQREDKHIKFNKEKKV